MQEKLLIEQLFDSSIKEVEEILNNYKFDTNDINEYIKSLSNDIKLLLKFSVDDFKKYDFELNPYEIKQFRFCKELNKKGEKLTSKYNSFLNSLRNRVINYLKSRIRVIEVGQNIKIKRAEKILENLKNNKEKYLNNLIDKECLDIITNLIKENLEANKALMVLKGLTSRITHTEKENEKLEETNLSYDDLERLLKEFDIKLSKLKKENQMMLMSFGNLDKIRKILIEFRFNEIEISRYIQKKQKQIVTILCYSNDELVHKLLLCYLKHGIDLSSSEIIEKLLGCPTNFINRKYLFTNKEKNKSKKFESESSTYGTHSDCLNNIELMYMLYKNEIKRLLSGDKSKEPIFKTKEFELIELLKQQGLFEEEKLEEATNYLFNLSFEKCPTVFSVAHESFNSSIKALNLYDIPVSAYYKCLTSLLHNNQMDTMDSFIEAGLSNYVKANLSRLSQNPHALLFYKIKLIHLMNIDMSNYYRGRGLSSELVSDNPILVGNVSISNSNYLEVTYSRPIINTELNGQVDEIDGSIFSSKIVSEFEKMRPIINGRLTDDCYVINGIIISRRKFLRIYTNMINNGMTEEEAVNEGIFRNSILTELEYQNLRRYISELTKNNSIGAK